MKKIVIAGIMAVAGVCGLLSAPVSAITCPADTPGFGGGEVGSLAECMLDPKDKPDDIFPMVKNIINVILGILGVVAVLVIILGGFYFLTSQGDAAKVTKGKNTILYGVVGLVIALLAFAIVNFVMDSLFSGSGAGDSSSEPEAGQTDE